MARAGLSAGFAGLRERLVAAIDTQLAHAADNGLDVDDLGSADELSARIGAAIPIGRHPTATLVGPCYGTPGLSRWLGISKQAIDKRNRDAITGVVGRSDRRCCPAMRETGCAQLWGSSGCLVMISASGVRIGWVDLPSRVRGAVEQILGAPVVQARTQPGGFSPGSAARVRTADGRRAFVKAAGLELNQTTVDLHRREAAVAAALPATVPAPALLGVHDDGRWIALVFDDVEGNHPVTPWIASEIDAVMAALSQVAAATRIAAPLPAAADDLASDMAGWRRISADPPADLDPWASVRLAQLRGLGDTALTALRGEHLLHTDIRADNLLIRPDGTVAVVDWPWATRGPAWLDRLLLLLNVNLYGGHDVHELMTRHLDADRGEVIAVLAGFAGFFIDAARQPPPPGLPTVRAFQAAQGERALALLKTLI